jgi:phosphoglycolate phosphatase
MIKKEETLMVGDSVNDIQAANRAGIKIATVPYGYQHEESIDHLHVDYKLNTFNDLKQIIH